jgi:hypothetical protein
MGSAQICRRLTDGGIPAPNKDRLMKGIVRDERYAKSEWAIPIIKRILTSQVYLGHMEQGRKRGALYEGGRHEMIDKSEWTVVYNTHEPIISQELFDRVKSVMDARTAAYKEHEGKYAHLEKPKLLLKDLLFCADCGRPLYRYKSVKKKYDRVYWIYQCRSHNNLLNCPIKYIHEKNLYDAVYETIRLELQRCADAKGVIEKMNRESDHKTRLSKFDTDIETAEKKLRRIASLRQAIYDDYAAKLLTVSEYQFATEKYDADTETERTRLETAKREKAEYTQNSTPANKWLTAFMRFTDAKEFTAEMAQALIERVEVSNRNHVKVCFKFRDEYMAIQSSAEVA